jgi:hypothetical protein
VFRGEAAGAVMSPVRSQSKSAVFALRAVSWMGGCFRDPRRRRWLEETSVVEQRGAMGLGAGVVVSNVGTSRARVTP